MNCPSFNESHDRNDRKGMMMQNDEQNDVSKVLAYMIIELLSTIHYFTYPGKFPDSTFP